MKGVPLIAAILAASVLAACASNPESTAITVEASGLKFQPATLEVTAGQPVTLVLDNRDSVEHDFSIMEFPTASMTAGEESNTAAGHDMGGMTMQPELHMAAGMGQRASIQFTASQPGTYEFFCTVAGHKEAGMVGTLVVKAP